MTGTSTVEEEMTWTQDTKNWACRLLGGFSRNGFVWKDEEDDDEDEDDIYGPEDLDALIDRINRDTVTPNKIAAVPEVFRVRDDVEDHVLMRLRQLGMGCVNAWEVADELNYAGWCDLAEWKVMRLMYGGFAQAFIDEISQDEIDDEDEDDFKSVGDQAANYALRAACWTRTPPAAIVRHEDADTMLLYDAPMRTRFAPHLPKFGSAVTFSEIRMVAPHSVPTADDIKAARLAHLADRAAAKARKLLKQVR